VNIILFGCKDTTLHTARFLRNLGLGIDLITIPPILAKANDVAGYEDLTEKSELFSSVYVAQSYSLREKGDLDYIESINDSGVGFCIGWQRLIPQDLLERFSVGVFGMHGSSRNLPYGKGRSPMNWALIEGRKWFHTNLFKYQPGVDDGPIVDTYTFSINLCDTAETMHYKNTLAMCHLIKSNLEALVNGKKKTHPQSIVDGESFYPKRKPSDGIIDWRDDIYNIERLIRAVTKPFSGAFGFLEGKEIIIFRGSIFYTDVEKHPFINSTFGEILDVFPNNKFLVRCSGGVMIIHDYKGDKPVSGEVFDVSEGALKKFERNDFGFFDV
jgi:UDP-4-amino-4-deoxy-L-arabinose formyltransferase/UDP-glucuronic acid dehydrogenase (UDP-4-keto-hexauronic acid decarboxylating)